MVHTMIHQKKISIWYLAIRVCDYGIAGLFQLQCRRRVIFFLIASMIMSIGFTVAEEDKWIAPFDGKTLNGWEKVGSEESKWVVIDGALTGTGTHSMLVCTKGPFKNFRYRAEVRINDGGNSGLYFRASRNPTFKDGYEAQIDSTHKDPIRTGSLYGFLNIYKDLVQPNEWFTYELEVRDDQWRRRDLTRIRVIVNGDELYEYLDFSKAFTEGHFAFQQHDPGSVVNIRKVEVMPLTN
jgi:hypothetical protein